MAERRATNKYYPPDWDPSKGSINKHNNSHPLRHRAKKVDQGILVVRFELPFNIWCLACNNHIGMGVRYNAEKFQTGNYYSTPIYKFKMKCHLCDNHFEIQTNPAKLDYAIVSGARKQEEAHDDESHRSKQLVTDAMSRLERNVEDKFRSDALLPGLREIIRWRSRWADSFAANQLVRSQFRKRRKDAELRKVEDKKLLKKLSLAIPLEPASSRDVKEAKFMCNTRKEKRKESTSNYNLRIRDEKF